MYVLPEIRNRYTSIQPVLAMVEAQAGGAVSNYCGLAGFAYVARTKTVESLAEKLESGRYSSWAQVDDLFACAIIVPTHQSETAVLEWLRKTFIEVTTKLRGSTSKAPDVFRFDATRFIGKLRAPSEELGREALYGISFEVQIRTAFEHAWSVTTHALVYKAEHVDWKRLRVAAQLKAAVEQLDSLILAFQASAATVVAHDWPDVKRRNRITERLRALFTDSVIPSELAPKDWSRLSENCLSAIKAGSDSNADIDVLVNQCIDAVEKEARTLASDKVPRSITLLQLVLGVAMREKLIGPRFNKFFPMVTTSLEFLYPESKAVNQRFDLSS